MLQLRSWCCAAAMVAAVVSSGAPARADMVFSATGTLQNRASSNLDPLGLQGATLTFQARFAEGAIYQNPAHWNGGPGVAAPSSHSFTISGASNPAANGSFAAQNAGGIVFSAFPAGQFRPLSSGGNYDYGGAIELLVNGQTFRLQNMLTAVGVNQNELLVGQPLQAHHFGGLSSDFDFTMLGNSYTLTGGSTSVSISPASVPEPTTTAIFGIGGAVAAIGALRRRWRRRKQGGAASVVQA